MSFSFSMFYATTKDRNSVVGGIHSAQFESHHCIVQHTQSIFIDCQPHLALLNRRGRDGLWTGKTKTGRVTDAAHLSKCYSVLFESSSGSQTGPTCT